MEPQNKVEQLEQRVQQLENIVRGLQQADQVTPEVARSLGEIISGASGTTIGSKTQAVDEAGSGTYNVPTIGVGFIKIGDVDVMYW